MQHIYCYRIKELYIKLVIEMSLYWEMFTSLDHSLRAHSPCDTSFSHTLFPALIVNDGNCRVCFVSKFFNHRCDKSILDRIYRC